MRRTAGFKLRRRKRKGDAQEAEPQWHAPARDTREGVSEGMPRFLERTAAPAPAPVQPAFQPTLKADDATAAPPPVMEETPAPVEVPEPAPEPVAEPQPEPAPEPEAEAEAAEAEAAPTPAVEPVEKEVLGPYGATLDPIEGEPLGKFGCGDHASGHDMSYAGAAPEATGTATPTRLRVNAQLSFDSSLSNRQEEDRLAKPDAVSGTLSSGSSTNKGAVALSADDYGGETATYSVDTISWSSSTPGTVNVKARIFTACLWNVQSLGSTDISGANDADVTSATWKAIVADLTPDATGRAKRAHYWAQDLTEKHEKKHAKDDIDRAALYVPTAKAWLDTQTVSAPTGKSGEDPKVSGEVKALLDKVKDKVKADGWAYYLADGEDRAYADGKSSYQARVDGIKARAVTEKWP